jgi:uncharacterized protein (DUF3820 family)
MLKGCRFDLSINHKTFFMQNFTLRFGKYKGQQFLSTPTFYQQWLLKQDWFKVPAQLTEVEKASKQISQLSGQLKGWNGYSSKGAAIYDSLFDAEVALDQAVENERKYFGMNEETKRAEMDWEYAEISACNMVDDYYNN